MKKVVLLFLSVGSLIAFVFIGVTMINTGDNSLMPWLVVSLIVSLGCAVALSAERRE